MRAALYIYAASFIKAALLHIEMTNIQDEYRL